MVYVHVSLHSVKVMCGFVCALYMQEYLKEMWAHSPQEEGHHPSKFLSPMVHTSSSKECLVSSPASGKAQADSLHDIERGAGGDSESLASAHAALDHLKLFQQTLGRGSAKGGSGMQRGKRTRNNSFYVAMAATSFKKRPDRHRAKIKCVSHTACIKCIAKSRYRLHQDKSHCHDHRLHAALSLEKVHACQCACMPLLYFV